MGINTVMFKLSNVAFATVAVQMQNYYDYNFQCITDEKRD